MKTILGDQYRLIPRAHITESLVHTINLIVMTQKGIGINLKEEHTCVQYHNYSIM